jgi:hypothetical protein
MAAGFAELKHMPLKLLTKWPLHNLDRVPPMCGNDDAFIMVLSCATLLACEYDGIMSGLADEHVSSRIEPAKKS